MMNDEKRSNIIQTLLDMDIQVACITETWFDSKNGKFTANIKDAGYELIHGFRENQRGGGVAILYKNSLAVKPGEASSTKYQSFEFSFLVLTVMKSKLLLICVYRKQEISCRIFCEELEKLVEQLFDKGDSVMIVGDFNLWVDEKDDKDSEKVLTLMNKYGLFQLVDKPTHREGHTLDHVYINPLQTDIEIKVIEETLGLTTDHYPIIIEIPTVEHQQEKQTIAFRNFKNIDAQMIQTEFKQVFAEIADSEETSFERNYSKYDTLSRDIIEKHAPIITKTLKDNLDPPWMDAEYKSNRIKRRKLEKKIKRNKENRDEYIKQRKLCAEMAITKQKEYYSKIINGAGNDQKMLFKIANELLDKKKRRILPEHDDSVKLANEFNKYYVENFL